MLINEAQLNGKEENIELEETSIQAVPDAEVKLDGKGPTSVN